LRLIISHQPVRTTLTALGRGHVRLLVLGAILLLVASAFAVYLAEQGSAESDLKSLDSCLWWAVVTMSTVGYGDLVPQTGAGRIIAVIPAVVGPVLLVTLVSVVGVTLYEEGRKAMRGEAQVQAKDHVIVCGWNLKAKDVINELRLSPKFRKEPIVVIDDAIDSKPLEDDHLFFVHGSPCEVEILERANVRHAKYAIVLAADSTPAADQKTVLTVLAIESLDPSILTCAELNDPDNAGHLQRANCDVVVNTNVLVSKLLAMSVENRAVNGVISELVTHSRGSEISGMVLPQKYEGASFRAPFEELKASQNLTVIGIERNCENLINPTPDFVLQPGDTLLVIS
jgi:voltage-gated potassium channel